MVGGGWWVASGSRRALGGCGVRRQKKWRQDKWRQKEARTGGRQDSLYRVSGYLPKTRHAPRTAQAPRYRPSSAVAAGWSPLYALLQCICTVQYAHIKDHIWCPVNRREQSRAEQSKVEQRFEIEKLVYIQPWC